MISNIENIKQNKDVKIETRVAVVSDLIGFEPRYNEDKCHVEKLSLYIENFPSTTIIINNKVIAIGGFIRSHKGVWSSWNIVSKEYINYKKSTFKYIVISFNKLKERVNNIETVHRFQALVSADRPEDIKFNLILGFKKEALLKQYDIYKKDMFMMSELIKGDE